MHIHILNQVILIIAASFIGGFIARSISLPPILGYIVSGIVFGVIGTNMIQSEALLGELSQVGVALLLFTLGFEISVDSLKRINLKILAVGVGQVVLTALVLLPFFRLLGFEFQVAVLFSILLSFSSTAVIIKILQENGYVNDFPGNIVFIILLIQDLFIIPIIFFQPLLFSGSISASDIFMFVFSLVKTTAIFVVLFLASKFLFPRLMNLIFRYPSHELAILASIFITAISIALLTNIGIPEAIAAFLAGVLISDEGKNLAPLSEMRPLRDIFLVIFFVMTGMMLDLPFLWEHFPQVLIVSVGVVCVKTLIIYLLLRIAKFNPSSSVFVSVYLANIGEFAAVIGQIAYNEKFITSDTYNFLLSVFIVSLLLIPAWIYFFKEYIIRLANLKLLRPLLGDASYVLRTKKTALTNHVVICGHGRVGKQIRTILDYAGIDYVVIDFDRKIISNLQAAQKYAIYGDPTDKEILAYSSIDRAKAVVIALPDRSSQKKITSLVLEVNPKAVILCRSHNEKDKYELISLGVNSITIPEFEAGVKMSREVLEVYGLPIQTIRDLLKRLRRDNVA